MREREREKEIGETPLREKLEVRENLCAWRVGFVAI